MELTGNITGFQHLGIPVADLEKSVAFYSSLGFRIENRSELEETGGTTQIAFMVFGSFCIEFYQPAGNFDFAPKPGQIDHFAMDVRDIDSAFIYFKDAGQEILEEAPVFLPIHGKGVKYFTVLGPDGEKVEFNQMVYQQ